jgi:hypothetical protein
MADTEGIGSQLKWAWTGIKGFLSWALIIWVAVAFLTPVYQHLDYLGYIPHTKEVPLSFYGDWLNKEIRECVADMPTTDDGAMVDLQCGYGPKLEPGRSHTIKINFWGRTSRPGIDKPLLGMALRA